MPDGFHVISRDLDGMTSEGHFHKTVALDQGSSTLVLCGHCELANSLLWRGLLRALCPVSIGHQ